MTATIAYLAAAIGDGRVWVALGLACAAGLLLVLVGVLIARRIGLLDPDGDATETLSVGLSLGLVAFAAAWASIASAGGSVFVPIAVAIVLAIAVGRGRPSLRLRVDRQSVRVGAAAAFFLVAIGLLYATTIAPSPRDGYQAVEFFDVGYYSVLGADLAATGRESIYGPAGFAGDPGPAGADLVPLGRTVARRRGDRPHRGVTAARTPPDRAAPDPARSRDDGRHARPPPGRRPARSSTSSRCWRRSSSPRSRCSAT